MSYDIRLMYGKEIAKVLPHREGGVVEIMGDNACLNITYNYSAFFSEHLDEGITWLNGQSADKTIPKLEKVVEALSSFSPDKDYWKPTAGNAGKALSILLEWARLHPNAVWNVSI